MALIKTWGDILAELKDELKIQGTNEDAFLLATANEVLIEICASVPNSRDLRIDSVVAFSVGTSVDFNGYLHEIEQVYYQKFAGATFQQRWELTEANGVVVPPPISGPDAYTVKNTTTVVGTPKATFTMYPLSTPATIGDKLHIIGTGFLFITDASSIMPYVAFYPMLKRSILQRMQIKRNVEADRVGVISPTIERAANAAGIGTQDKQGNSSQN